MQLILCDSCGITNRVRNHSEVELPICGQCGARIGKKINGPNHRLERWMKYWRDLPQPDRKTHFEKGASDPHLSPHERLGCKAQVLWMTGDLDAALKKFDEAIQLAPDSSIELLNRGNLHFERGDLDAALRDFELSLRGSPALPGDCYLNYQMLKAMSPEAKTRLRERRLSKLDV